MSVQPLVLPALTGPVCSDTHLAQLLQPHPTHREAPPPLSAHHLPEYITEETRGHGLCQGLPGIFICVCYSTLVF